MDGDASNLNEIHLRLKKLTAISLYAGTVATILKSSKNTLEHLKLEDIFVSEDDIFEVGSTTLILNKFEAKEIPASVAVKVVIASQRSLEHLELYDCVDYDNDNSEYLYGVPLKLKTIKSDFDSNEIIASAINGSMSTLEHLIFGGGLNIHKDQITPHQIMQDIVPSLEDGFQFDDQVRNWLKKIFPALNLD